MRKRTLLSVALAISLPALVFVGIVIAPEADEKCDGIDDPDNRVG